MKSVQERWGAAKAVMVQVTGGKVVARGLTRYLPKGGTINTDLTQLGMSTEYASVDDLPTWVKERLLKLSIAPESVLVDNIGGRSSDGTYSVWVPEDL